MRKVTCTRDICKFKRGSDSEMEVDQEGNGFMDNGDNYAVTLSSSGRGGGKKHKRNRVDQGGKGRRKRKSGGIRKKAIKKRTRKGKSVKKQTKRRRRPKRKSKDDY